METEPVPAAEGPSQRFASTTKLNQRQTRPKNAMNVAFSSPNLKSLNSSADLDSQRWLEGYLAGKLNEQGGRRNYVDPYYNDLRETSKSNKPVWSLSGPLPHVLDPAVREKLNQKNLEAKSRASTRPGSLANSRANSSLSVAMDRSPSWKSKMKNSVFGSRVKLNDEEAATQPNTKPSVSMVEQASVPRPRVNFSLNSSRRSSIIQEEEASPDSLTPDKLVDDESSISNDDAPIAHANYWAKVRYYLREGFAEFLGTLVLVIFGVGGNLQATVTNGAGGTFESLSFAWGFGCMLGVYIAGGISGGHVNPAVTISLAIFRRFPWKKVPIYIFFQIWGAFFGGALAYGYHWSSITSFEGGKDIRTVATGACLFTNPKPDVTWRNAFFDEFIGTAILVGCLFAILDDTNAPPTSGMSAFIIGLLIAAIGMALGYQTSFTLNPARDLGPRLFAWWIGYGPKVFHFTHWWWAWGVWGGTIGGGIAGGLIYDLMIFTGPESPINYPDNGYIEEKMNQLGAKFEKNDIEMENL